MKALCVHQPWASMIARGAKIIETRSWRTRYRGPIAILATKRRRIHELIHAGACWNVCGALGRRMGEGDSVPLYDALPFGSVLAVGELVDCRPVETFTIGELDGPRTPDMPHGDLYQFSERQLGNYDLGRYGWVLANVQPLSEPLPWRGRQGLFDIHLPERAVT